MLSSLVYRPHCQKRSFFLFIHHLCIQCFSQRLSGDIDSSASCCKPMAFRCILRCIILIFPGSDSGLADVIHSGPYEISQYSWMFFRNFIKLRSVPAKCFRSQNQSFRIFFQIMPISQNPVIISRNIHIFIGISCLYVTAVQTCPHFHEGISHHSCQTVIEFTAYRFLFGRCVFCFFITVHTKSHRTQQIEENIDTAGYRSRTIQAVQIGCHILRQLYPFFLCRFRHFVSGGIHHNTGVVIVFVHHVQQIFFPLVFHIQRIVITCFMDIPHVSIFIQHQHSQSVTGIQQCFGTGIMCRPDRIISGLFQKSYFTFLGIRITAGSEKTVIMMNAGSLKNRSYAVYAETFLCIPAKFTDSKGSCADICPGGNAISIQVRILRTPQSCIFYLD